MMALDLISDVQQWASEEAIKMPGGSDSVEGTVVDVDSSTPSKDTDDGKREPENTADIDVHAEAKQFEKRAVEIAKQQTKQVESGAAKYLNKQDLDLKQAVEKGGFEIGSALGQRFSRSPAQKSTEYRSLLSNEDKKQFREEWAEAKYKEVLEKKVYSRKHSTIRVERGRYLSFKRICEEEGEDESGVLAAKRIHRAMSREWPTLRALQLVDRARRLLVHQP